MTSGEDGRVWTCDAVSQYMMYLNLCYCDLSPLGPVSCTGVRGSGCGQDEATSSSASLPPNRSCDCHLI